MREPSIGLLGLLFENITSIILNVAFNNMISPSHCMIYDEKPKNIVLLRRIPPSPHIVHGEKLEKFTSELLKNDNKKYFTILLS
jgi:hypothetical protein